MGWIIGFLTFVLVVDCLFLILLILVQLPKKEAGVGQAFGGSATDALFGAGTGTALTKLTKYATGFFLAVTLLLTVLNANQAKNRDRSFEDQLNAAAQSLPPPPPPAGATSAVPVVAPPPATNTILTSTSNLTAPINQLLTTDTNTAPTPATNQP